LNFLDIFSKNTHIKFHENPCVGSRVVPCGQLDIHMTKHIVTFYNFVNAPNNLWYFGLYTVSSWVGEEKK